MFSLNHFFNTFCIYTRGYWVHLPEVAPAENTKQVRVKNLAVQTAFFLLIAVLLLLREPGILCAPKLLFEDGSNLVSYYYTYHNLDSILRFQCAYGTGYITLLINIFSYLILFLPLHTVPYLFNLVALFFAAYAFSCLAHQRYRSLIESDTLRFIICLIFALYPAGHRGLPILLTNIQWPALILGFLMAIAPFPERHGTAIMAMLFQVLIVWTHPLAIVFTPVYLLGAVKNLFTSPNNAGSRRRDALLYLLILAAAILFQFFGTKRYGESVGHDFYQWALLTIYYVLKHIVLQSILGRQILLWHLQNVSNFVLVPIAAMLIMFLLFLVYRRRRIMNLPFLLYSTYFILITTTAFIVGRNQTFANLTTTERYSFVQTYLFLMMLAQIITPYILVRKHRRLAASMALLAIFAHLTLLNYQNNHHYLESAPEAKRVAAFLSLVEKETAEQSHEPFAAHPSPTGKPFTNTIFDLPEIVGRPKKTKPAAGAWQATESCAVSTVSQQERPDIDSPAVSMGRGKIWKDWRYSLEGNKAALAGKKLALKITVKAFEPGAVSATFSVKTNNWTGKSSTSNLHSGNGQWQELTAILEVPAYFGYKLHREGNFSIILRPARPSSFLTQPEHWDPYELQITICNDSKENPCFIKGISVEEVF